MTEICAVCGSSLEESEARPGVTEGPTCGLECQAEQSRDLHRRRFREEPGQKPLDIYGGGEG